MISVFAVTFNNCAHLFELVFVFKGGSSSHIYSWTPLIHTHSTVTFVFLCDFWYDNITNVFLSSLFKIFMSPNRLSRFQGQRIQFPYLFDYKLKIEVLGRRRGLWRLINCNISMSGSLNSFLMLISLLSEIVVPKERGPINENVIKGNI